MRETFCGRKSLILIILWHPLLYSGTGTSSLPDLPNDVKTRGIFLKDLHEYGTPQKSRSHILTRLDTSLQVMQYHWLRAGQALQMPHRWCYHICCYCFMQTLKIYGLIFPSKENLAHNPILKISTRTWDARQFGCPQVYHTGNIPVQVQASGIFLHAKSGFKPDQCFAEEPDYLYLIKTILSNFDWQHLIYPY